MTGYLKLYDGSTVTLPQLLAWELSYGSGVPCDSFWVNFLWSEGWEEPLGKAVTFFCVENGETVFTGVVDEYTFSRDTQGGLAEISGRSMAARLLDNEAVTADYLNATTNVILQNHVTPYGITVADKGDLAAVPSFSVTSGSSEWKVLHTFARYHNGVMPRFDRLGRLHLSPLPAGGVKVLDSTVPVTELCCREKRYGVLSSVLVRYRSTQAVVTVNNEEFLAQGGCARQVITMPNYTTRAGMKTSARYQLETSQEERFVMEVTIPQAFWAWPGDRVESRLGISGWDKLWQVQECRVTMDEKGYRTFLTLTAPHSGL